MENDQQINGPDCSPAHDLEQTKRVFLSDELLTKTPKPEIYSLADEYAESKKNKNYLVYVLILMYIAAIGIGVLLITAIEESKSKRIEVNIAEFRQFNLMELLAEQKENQEKLVQLQQELEDLRISTKKELEKLSPKEQQKVLAAANEKMRQLEESYAQQIKAREEAIKSLEKTISAEKQQMVNSSQAIDETLNKYKQTTEQQGVEIERLKIEYEGKIAKLESNYQNQIDSLKNDNQELRDTLILRYNPIFSKGEIAAVINSKLGNTISNTWNKYSKVLTDEAIWNEPDFNQLHNKIYNQRVIINSLLEVDYTNSIPPALNRLNKLSKSITGDYETLWGNLAQRVREKNDYLGSFEYSLNYLSTIRRESGYVIDARDPNRIIVFIGHLYSVKKGDTAYIFKNDDIAVAKVELTPERNRIIAKVVTTLRPVKIEPFDKILMKLQGD
jgi:phage host-nuclease inhibitor protein Gam